MLLAELGADSILNDGLYLSGRETERSRLDLEWMAPSRHIGQLRCIYKPKRFFYEHHLDPSRVQVGLIEGAAQTESPVQTLACFLPHDRLEPMITTYNYF